MIRFYNFDPTNQEDVFRAASCVWVSKAQGFNYPKHCAFVPMSLVNPPVFSSPIIIHWSNTTSISKVVSNIKKATGTDPSCTKKSSISLLPNFSCPLSPLGAERHTCSKESRYTQNPLLTGWTHQSNSLINERVIWCKLYQLYNLHPRTWVAPQLVEERLKNPPKSQRTNKHRHVNPELWNLSFSHKV